MAVSCIIPVYNEGKRIEGVLKAVCGHPLVNEVIVVNDCSTDDTAEMLRDDKRIQLISYTPNQGKTHAVQTGIKAAKNDTIMLLDGDLVGLTHEDLNKLITPVTSNEVDVTISLRGNSLRIYKMMGIDIFSGERVFRKETLGPLDALSKLPGFGLEAFFNERIIEHKFHIKIVWLPHVSHVLKEKKFGFWKGTYGELKMVLNVLNTMNIFKIMEQARDLKRLRGKKL